MLDAETVAAIQEAVKSGITDFDTKFETRFRDLTKKQEAFKNEVTKEVSGLLDTELTKRLEPWQSNLQFIEDVKKEVEAEEKRKKENTTDFDDNKEEPPQRNNKGKTKTIDEILAVEQKLRAEFEARASEDRKKLNDLEVQLKADQERALAEQEKAKTTTLRNEALNRIRESNLVSPGKEARLFALLEQDGKLVKTDDGFKIASKDKFNDDIQVDISEILPELIKTTYDEYSIPRGGTGTGSQPGSQRNNQNFSTVMNLSAQELYDKQGGLGEDLIKALEQTYSA